jgi:hypothetical protein
MKAAFAAGRASQDVSKSNDRNRGSRLAGLSRPISTDTATSEPGLESGGGGEEIEIGKSTAVIEPGLHEESMTEALHGIDELKEHRMEVLVRGLSKSETRADLEQVENRLEEAGEKLANVAAAKNRTVETVTKITTKPRTGVSHGGPTKPGTLAIRRASRSRVK